VNLLEVFTVDLFFEYLELVGQIRIQFLSDLRVQLSKHDIILSKGNLLYEFIDKLPFIGSLALLLIREVILFLFFRLSRLGLLGLHKFSELLFNAEESVFRACLDPALLQKSMLCYFKTFFFHLKMLEIDTKTDPPVASLFRFVISIHQKFGEKKTSNIILAVSL